MIHSPGTIEWYETFIPVRASACFQHSARTWRLRRRPRLESLLGWAHQTNIVTLGISDYREARTPEGVVRGLPTLVPGGHKLRISYVYCLPAFERDAQQQSAAAV